MTPVLEVIPRNYFEDILPRTGWGLYYRFLIAMACVSCFAQAFAFFALPFSIALSTCEHYITKEIILALHISFVLGRAFGGLLLSPLGDIYGRKRLLTHSMLLIFLSSFMAAFAYNYYVIMFSAIVLASGLETNYCVVRVHLAEILPLTRRGFYLSICDIFWSIGYIFVAFLGVVIKSPANIETSVADMRLTYWRMILAVAGGLNITMACASALLEESPRYFLHIKRNYLAVLTLKQFFAINKSSYGEYLGIKETDLNNMVNGNIPSIYPEPHGCINLLCKTILLMVTGIGQMFSRRYLKTTMMLFFIKLPLLVLGHLEINNILSKYSYASTPFIQNGLEVIHLDELRNMTLCNSIEGREMLYYIYFILAATILFGIFSVTCFVDFIGRKILSCTTLVLCGICYVTLFFVKNITGKIALSTVLMTSFSAVMTTISIVNIESYPTALRCTSWGVLNLPGLIISPFVIKYYHLFADYTFIIHGWIFSGAAIAAYFLHDLKRKPMIE